MKFGLIQENYLRDKHSEWKMLVCCVLLNQTTRVQVDKVIDELFDRYPDPLKMSKADQSSLAELIRPLGFQNRRSKTLIDMANEYLEIKVLERTKEAKKRGYAFDPRALPGCGEYAFHSWMIFTKCVDTFRDWEDLFDECPVEDKDLLAYLKWRSRYDPRNRRKRRTEN